MRNAEVEAYLDRGGDTVFLPVGTVELHGDFPLDCETICAEAFALKLAEKSDGLSLTGLPFFYPGATRVGRGTVYMSIADGAAYLGKLSDSLLQQGFRRQIFVTCHGPAYLTVNQVIMDAFHRHKVPFLHISMINVMRQAAQKGWEGGLGSLNDLIYGAYKLMGCLDSLYVDKDAPQFDSLSEGRRADPFNQTVARLQSLGNAPGNVGFFYPEFSNHGGGEGAQTPEERDRRAEKGEAMLEELAALTDPQAITEQLRFVDETTQNTVLPRYPFLNTKY